MKQQLRINWICDHCSKYYIRKDHALRHEKYCGKNPNNKHKCFEFCPYLKKEKEIDSGPYIDREYTVFICKKTGNYMWSYIAERRKIECDGIRMPLECKHYEEYISGLEEEFLDHYIDIKLTENK